MEEYFYLDKKKNRSGEIVFPKKKGGEGRGELVTEKAVSLGKARNESSGGTKALYEGGEKKNSATKRR